ncbi:RNA ligase [Actinocorallia sp. B10E7]|uniref:RNA ligase n=1 Tax=Actinocorallia sp. B10E7 TaxID=3153558 RepID=UPI00325F8DA3
MRPHLSDLFDPARLADAVAGGYVREQTHPELPLRILNYTEKTQYERAWTEVTRFCRGLVVDEADRIVARPYPKFFNYGEYPEGAFDLDAPAVVADKADGSLGVLYPTPDGYAVATRGSFTSDQALHATEVWRERYADRMKVPEGVTCLFEIIYPANRIVCDYGGLDDLVLLGGVDIATGRPAEVDGWPGPAVERFAYGTLREALAAPPRPGAEGLIVRLPGRDGAVDLMVKLKQDDYLALHRVITGLNARVVWERLGAGEDTAAICEGLPDEFHGWVRDMARGLADRQRELLARIEAEHAAIVVALPDGWGRKDYAALASRSPLRGWLFQVLDGKDPSARIWHSLKPSGDDRPFTLSEDVS